MQYRVLKPFQAAFDGITVQALARGQEVSFAGSVIDPDSLVESGHIEAVGQEPPADIVNDGSEAGETDAKATDQAPENKKLPAPENKKRRAPENK